MTFVTTYNLWSIAGMVYALAGAALFCNAVFSFPSGFSYATASRDKPLARHVARRLNAQWLDMRIGSTLLVIGFFLQLTGALGTASLNVPAVFVLLALALCAGYYALAKDLIADRLIADAEPESAMRPGANIASATIAEQHTTAAAPTATPVTAHVVGIEQTKQESAAYADEQNVMDRTPNAASQPHS